MTTIDKQIREFDNVTTDNFETEVASLNEPAVLRGLVRDWPAVLKGQESNEALCEYLRSFDAGASFKGFFGPPEIEGRFCYNDDLTGFNYVEKETNLDEILSLLIEHGESENAPSFYAGSVTAARHVPGFTTDNQVPFLDPSVDPRLWLGHRTRVAPHYDIPRNIACVVSGRRRFTVFPIGEVKNLYVGPLDFTPAGQSLSIVDFHDPDFDKYPKYRQALDAASSAELEPGDAIYIPSLWWHQVEGLDSFNVMANFWWSDSPARLESPFNSLMHCMLSIRELPEAQRMAWKELFDFYIFKTSGEPMEHLPAERRGVLGDLTPERARQLRAHLLNTLNR